jgi:hypothetical protein
MSPEYVASQEALFATSPLEGTPEEIADYRREESAKQMASRRTSFTPPHFDDEGGDAAYIAFNEMMDFQRKAANATNPVEAERYSRMAELAALKHTQLQNGTYQQGRVQATPKQEEVEEADDFYSDPASQIIERYGEQAVTETLEWAGENLSPEVAEQINDILADNEVESTEMAYEAISVIRDNPDLISTGEPIAFDEGVVTELEAQFGEYGTQLATINQAMTNGVCTKADAMRLVLSDQRLMQVALQAAQRGLIVLGV